MRDVAVERAILASLFNHPDSISDVSDLVTTESFTEQSNKVIYQALSRVLEDPGTRPDYISLVSAADSLGYKDYFSKKDEIDYLRAVMNLNVKRENVRKFAGKLAKLEIARTLHDRMSEGLARLEKVTGNETPDEIFQFAETPLFEVVTGLGRKEDAEPLGKGLQEYLAHLESGPPKQVGLATGFQVWDRVMGGGLRRKTVNLVGARLKAGKTTKKLNVACYVCGALVAGVNPVPVLDLDTEMDKTDNWHRTLAILSGIKINEIEEGRYAYAPELKKRVHEAAGKIEKMPYTYRNVSGMPFEEILSTARRWIVREVGLEADGRAKPCLLIYDYLKLMTSAPLQKNLAEFQVLGFMMTQLHNFTVRWDIPCLSFVQLNREGIDGEGTDVIAQSDRLGWLCSNFTILKPTSPDEIAEDPRYNRKLVVAAARHGPGTEQGQYIKVHFDKERARMTEGPLSNEQRN